MSVDAEVMIATGKAEREAAVRMADRLPPRKRQRTLGADRGYETRDFGRDIRVRNITPHIAPNKRVGAALIDARTHAARRL